MVEGGGRDDRPGRTLFEVSTDKVDSEVPSPAGGVLAEIRVPEGDTVDVGTVLAVVSDGSGPHRPPLPRHLLRPLLRRPTATLPPSSSSRPRPRLRPSPRRPAPTSPPPPPPPRPLRLRSPRYAAAVPAAGVNGANGSANVVLSPVVRRLLDENGIDPSEIRGTGLGGRITRSDVLTLIDEQRAGCGRCPRRLRPRSTGPGRRGGPTGCSRRRSGGPRRHRLRPRWPHRLRPR